MAFCSREPELNKRPSQQQQLSLFSAVVLAPRSSPELKPILSTDALRYSAKEERHVHRTWPCHPPRCPAMGGTSVFQHRGKIVVF